MKYQARIDNKTIFTYEDVLGEVLIDQATLEKRISELGTQISNDFAGDDVVFVCILRGGVVFMIDLMRHVTVPNQIEFMAVSSYGAGSRESHGEVRITYDLNTSIEGRNVIIVEDIIDSGHTLNAVIQVLSTRRPKSLCVCTLLDKYERREVEIPIRYCGFSIPNKFVYGYGLDLDEYFRNLPFIGVVDLHKLEQVKKESAS
jgi:hypoxanthine phosphoribosyltransferase